MTVVLTVPPVEPPVDRPEDPCWITWLGMVFVRRPVLSLMVYDGGSWPTRGSPMMPTVEVTDVPFPLARFTVY